MDTEDLRASAAEAARIGGTHALENISRRGETVSVARHDVKLALDIECQQRITEFLRRRYPNHAVLGEESSEADRRRRDADDIPRWIVDPIDGTVNFSHGIPVWSCSVAVSLGGRLLAGAVFAPELDELYVGARGHASTCNGTPIHVSRTESVDKAMVMTAMDRELAPGWPFCGLFRTLAKAAQKARIAGSAAVDLCWVAAGKADAYVEGSIYLWDVAAGTLIIEGAGGRCQVLYRRSEPHQMGYLASNGIIHEELSSIVTGTGLAIDPHAGLFGLDAG